MARAPSGWQAARDRRLVPRRVSKGPAIRSAPVVVPGGPAVELLRELTRRARGALVFERGGAVRLVALDGAVRRVARFASAEEAVAAFERGRVKWSAMPLPEHLQTLAASMKLKFEHLRNNL